MRSFRFPLSVDLVPKLVTCCPWEVNSYSSAVQFDPEQGKVHFFHLRHGLQHPDIQSFGVEKFQSMKSSISQWFQTAFPGNPFESCLAGMEYLVVYLQKIPDGSLVPIGSLTLRNNTVWNFSVHPLMRSKGIGTLMLQSTLQFLVQEYRSKIDAGETPLLEKCYLYVLPNNHRATKLYSSLGFQFIMTDGGKSYVINPRDSGRLMSFCLKSAM
mmetsp:Transcript_4653/g.7476  ORF Transcript_4653/g.7476 Transcript_4653/m.7476 type:complete len:213 (+) Transcript_4653:214-852(+)